MATTQREALAAILADEPLLRLLGHPTKAVLNKLLAFLLTGVSQDTVTEQLATLWATPTSTEANRLWEHLKPSKVTLGGPRYLRSMQALRLFAILVQRHYGALNDAHQKELRAKVEELVAVLLRHDVPVPDRRAYARAQSMVGFCLMLAHEVPSLVVEGDVYRAAAAFGLLTGCEDAPKRQLGETDEAYQKRARRSVAQRARTRISDPASRYEDEYAQLLHQLARNAAAQPSKGPTS
ncbi:MAG: hypothetical protein IPG17_23675 [Sandaracinaceae bacterium]|nr:hypothetical protein [Sandaracinaceae bacterium]